MIFQNIELKVDRILWHFTTRIFVLTPKTVSYAVHSFICVKVSLSEEKRKLNVRTTKKFSNFLRYQVMQSRRGQSLPQILCVVCGFLGH